MNVTGIKLDQQYAYWIIGLAAIAAVAFMLFGLTGFRTVIAFAVLFVVPTLLLLRKTDLEAEEKIFFSLFIGIGLFGLIAWAINQALPSFRLSVIAAFALVAAAAFFLPRILSKWQGKRL